MELIQIFSESSSRELDHFTIQEIGISGQVLMGMAAVSIYQEYRFFASGKEIIILSGSGNNGGDGLALGLLFHCSGEKVKIFRKNGKHSNEYLFYLKKAQDLGIEILDIDEFFRYDVSEKRETLLIDCILGTGFTPPLNDYLQSLIKHTNNYYKKKNVTILSVDALSGFSLEQENSEYVRADILAEIGVRKLPNIYSSILINKYSFHPIAFPINHFLIKNPIKQFLMTATKKEDIQSKRYRKQDSHKYTNGVACFVGGSFGMEGAILLAQKSFHSTGGGYSQLFSVSSEIKSLGLKSDTSLIYNHLNSESLISGIWDKASTIVIGPGLKKEDFSYDLDFFLKKKAFLIIDAGAISLIKGSTLHGRTIVTPHRGEFQEWVGKKINSENDFISELKEKSFYTKAYILLKGPISILSDPNGNLYFFSSPNAKLATMGTGDLLCGILAFFLSKTHDMKTAVLDSLSYLHLSSDMDVLFPTAEEIRKYLE